MYIQPIFEQISSALGDVRDHVAFSIPIPTAEGIAVAFYFIEQQESAGIIHVESVRAIDRRLVWSSEPPKQLQKRLASAILMSDACEGSFAQAYEAREKCLVLLDELLTAAQFGRDGFDGFGGMELPMLERFVCSVESLARLQGLQALYGIMLFDLYGIINKKRI